MTTTTSSTKKRNRTCLSVDIRLFHPTVIQHIKKNAMYSFSLITENDVVELIDPVISFLFHNSPNFELQGNGKYNHIFLFYAREDFIEIFDELFLEFNNFFYFINVSRYKKYDVIRMDNFQTYIIEENDK